MQDHRSVALEAACSWAAYAQEHGTAVTADDIVAAARKFAAFLTEPTSISFEAELDSTTPTTRTSPRKRATG